MARYQTAAYHEDMTEKRPLSRQDVAFLRNLQKELNTQDTMGNADPRFWVIRQPEERAAAPDCGDAYIMELSGCGEPDYIRDLPGLSEFLDEHDELGLELRESESGSWELYDTENSCSGTCLAEWQSLDDARSDDGFLERLTDNSVACEVREIEIIDTTVPNTLFLTHKGCEDHLRRYGYNYHAEAHAFAMTATRSPEYEALMKLVRTLDLDALEASLEP